MNRFDEVICQVWGMTETTCAGIMTPGMTKDLTGSIRRLLPNTEARLIDDDGKQINIDGEPGELWIRGPQVMVRYWTTNQPLVTASAMVGRDR
jgi:4-coumarate--CoA ligase